MTVTEWGNPPVLALRESEPRLPSPGELRIRVECAVVNFGDTLIATGRYQVKPDLPFVPGTECAGTVDAVGEGVTEYGVGDRVATSGFVGDPRKDRRVPGAFADVAIVPTANVAPIPNNLSFEDGVLLRSSIETSYEALYQGRLAAGETLLVLGATGGTGFAAVQIGKWMGARVIASASSAEKRAIAIAGGADAAIASDAPDWREQVRALTNGRGPDVVFDPVGDIDTEKAFRTLNWGGRLLVVGFAGGKIPSVATNLALLKGSSIVGVNLLQAGQFEPERIAAQRRTLYELSMQKVVTPLPVAGRYPLSAAGEAMVAAAGRQAGRIMITMTEEKAI